MDLVARRSRPADVAILGGGPAGCAAAIELRAEGCDVQLFTRTPRTTRLGQTLAPSARPLLRSLGVRDAISDAFRPCASIDSAWGGALDASASDAQGEQPHGWHLDGDALDLALMDRAAQAGVEVVRSARVRAASRAGGRWEIVVDAPGGRVVALAGSVIDASGRGGVLARVLRFPRNVVDRLVATWCVDDSITDASARTMVEASSDGWWFTAPAARGARVLFYYTDGDLLPRGFRGDAAWFAAALARTEHVRRLVRASGAWLRPTGAVLANTTLASRLVGSGWALAGDAAFTVDPLSSQGIVMALSGGIAAARALLDGQDALNTYAERTVAQFHAYLRARATYYAVSRFRGRPFWERRCSRAGGG